MKKFFLFAMMIGFSILAFWAVSSDWELKKEKLESGEVSYTLNYTENRGKPLSQCLKEMDKAFKIHLLLLTEQSEIQKDLRVYYKKNQPNELRNALGTSLTLTSPLLNPLRDKFELALKSTLFYKRLQRALEEKGFSLVKNIEFKKFMIFKKEGSTFFHAEVDLKAVPKK